MEILTTDEKNLNTYITKAWINDGGKTITLEMGDGSYICNIPYSNETIEEINKIMTNQFKENAQNKKRFERLSKFYKASAVISQIGAISAVSLLITHSEAYNGYIKGFGAILFGFLGSYCTVSFHHTGKEYKERVNEIKKLEYLEMHQDDFKNYASYPNSLKDATSITRELCSQTPNPFRTINSDIFEIKDLEQIENNIKKDKILKLSKKNVYR